MIVDCPNEICYFENQLLSYCLIFLPNSNPNCSIPCRREFCDQEVMADIMCPHWSCSPKITTTTSSTSTTDNLTTEDPTTQMPPTEGPSQNLLVSYSFNAILSLLLFSLLIFFVSLKIKSRIRQNRQQRLQIPSVRFVITDSPLSTSSSDNYATVPPKKTSENEALVKNKKKQYKAEINFQNQMRSFMQENFDETGGPTTVSGFEYLNSSSESPILHLENQQTINWECRSHSQQSAQSQQFDQSKTEVKEVYTFD